MTSQPATAKACPTPGTPLPWAADDEAEGMYFEVTDAKGDWDIALFAFGDPEQEPYLPTSGKAKANAAYAVHCANAYPTQAARIDALVAERDALREALGSYARLLLPIYMTLAEREMCEEPLADDAVLFSFMGSGASDNTTVGDYRKAEEQARTILAGPVA